MRLVSSRLAVGCGVCCLGLAAILFSSADSSAGDKIPAKLETYKERLRELEANYKKTLFEAIKDAEELEKKADEAVKKLFDEQFKTKDKDKKDKIKAELDVAKEERDRVAGFRKFYQNQQTGLKFSLGWDKLEDKLGATVSLPSAIIVDQLGLTKGEGVVVDFVPAKSLAAKIGLKPYDILIKIGGLPVPNVGTSYKKFASEIKTDGPVEAVVLRHGKQMSLSSTATTPDSVPKKIQDVGKDKGKSVNPKDDGK